MGTFPGASRETSSLEGALLAGKLGSVQSWGTGAVQDGEAGKNLLWLLWPPPTIACSCWRAPEPQHGFTMPQFRDGTWVGRTVRHSQDLLQPSRVPCWPLHHDLAELTGPDRTADPCSE